MKHELLRASLSTNGATPSGEYAIAVSLPPNPSLWPVSTHNTIGLGQLGAEDVLVATRLLTPRFADCISITAQYDDLHVIYT